MNPYERVFKRLEGEKVDRIPNLNIIMTFAAKYIDVPYKKYVTDYKFLVEGNIKVCEEFGIDIVSAISDPCREAYDLGAEIEFPENDVPIIKENLLKRIDDINNLSVKDPNDGIRMSDRIKAVKLFREKVGGYYPILGWVEGALAEAANLRGLEQLMMDFYEEPYFVEELLSICNQQAIKFAKSQIEAGADFIGIGDAVASLIGPKLYNKYCFEYEKELIKKIHDMGAKVKLHICGNISSILDIVPKTGADIIDLDWMVDFSKAVYTFSGKCSACGNFDPVGVLLQGSVKKVKTEVSKCIQAGNEKTFIAAGCEVPKDTPLENMYEIKNILLKSD